VASAPRQLSISEFQLGTRLGSHGGIAQGAQTSVFSTDQTVHVAMRLRDAPPGTVIKAVWQAPGGETLGEQTSGVRPGQDYVYFSADAENLPPGAGYRAEIFANGKPVTVLRFDLNSGG
jgi:hypothetical protein